MPSKSRHGRRKKLPRDRKVKGPPVFPAAAIQQEGAAQSDRPVAPAAAAPAPTPTLARYPYVGAELRRIGILAGIILSVLVVLSLVLL